MLKKRETAEQNLQWAYTAEIQWPYASNDDHQHLVSVKSRLVLYLEVVVLRNPALFELKCHSAMTRRSSNCNRLPAYKRSIWGILKPPSLLCTACHLEFHNRSLDTFHFNQQNLESGRDTQNRGVGEKPMSGRLDTSDGAKPGRSQYSQTRNSGSSNAGRGPGGRGQAPVTQPGRG